MTNYQINQENLKQAVDENIINQQQAEQLLLMLSRQAQASPRLSTGHVLYYLGGLLTIGALSVFIGSSLDVLLGWPLFFIGVSFFAGSYALAGFFKRKNHSIPSGIFAAICLSLTPLIIFSLQSALHLLPADLEHYQKFYRLVAGAWLPMELISLIVGVLLFYKFRFGFILFPVAVLLWFTSMDAYQLLTRHSLNDSGASLFALLFGLVEILILLRWDWKANNLRAQKLFWLYLAAVITFWGGLCGLWVKLNLDFIFGVVNLILLFSSVFLQRRIFAVCGGVGLFSLIGSLVSGSVLFPFMLIGLGLIIIYLARVWSRFEVKIVKRYQKFLPLRFQEVSQEALSEKL